MNVSVLVRKDCHLCDEAIGDLRAWLDRSPQMAGTEVELIDIEADDELHRRYLELIPVIRIDGRDVSRFTFDAEAFSAALEDHSQGAG